MNKKSYIINRFLKPSMTGLIVLFQFIPIAHLLFGNIRLFGKNFFVELPIFMIGLGGMLLFKKISKTWQLFFIILMILFLSLTTISISVFYLEATEFLSRRFFIIPVLTVIVIYTLLEDQQYRVTALKAILAATCIQCILGIIHHYFFPEYWYSSDAGDFGGFQNMGEFGIDAATREGGTMLSVSTFAYILLSGIITIVYVKNLPWKFNNHLWKLGFILFLFYGIMLSGSRGPIILALLIIIAWFFLNSNTHFYTKIVLFIIGSSIFLYFNFGHLIDQFVIARTLDSGDGGRYQKLILAADILSHDLFFLIGAPASYTAQAQIDGIYLSDNSYALLLVTFGFLAIIPIGVLLYISFFYIIRTKTILPILSGLFCLASTNSILWEPWVFYYTLSMTLIFYSLNKKHPTFSIKNQSKIFQPKTHNSY